MNSASCQSVSPGALFSARTGFNKSDAKGILALVVSGRSTAGACGSGNLRGSGHSRRQPAPGGPCAGCLVPHHGEPPDGSCIAAAPCAGAGRCDASRLRGIDAGGAAVGLEACERFRYPVVDHFRYGICDERQGAAHRSGGRIPCLGRFVDAVRGFRGSETAAASTTACQ